MIWNTLFEIVGLKFNNSATLVLKIHYVKVFNKYKLYLNTLKMTIQKIGRRKSENYNINHSKADVLHGWT